METCLGGTKTFRGFVNNPAGFAEHAIYSYDRQKQEKADNLRGTPPSPMETIFKKPTSHVGFSMVIFVEDKEPRAIGILSFCLSGRRQVA